MRAAHIGVTSASGWEVTMNRPNDTSLTTEGNTVIEDGEQSFILGKNRIKITEHFPADGKQLDELITDLITQKIKGKAAEIS